MRTCSVRTDTGQTYDDMFCQDMANTWGRIQAIKMVIAPKLNYLLSMLRLGVPGTTLQIIDKMFSQFIWAGKRPRMKIKMTG